MRKIYMLLLTVCFAAAVNAQVITSYSFSAISGTYTPLSGGTAVPSLLDDDVNSATAIPLGFRFYYMGVGYTSVRANSNGWLSFNPAVTTNAVNMRGNDFATSGTNAVAPVVAPLWDDLMGNVALITGGTPLASYATTGSVGSRVFTFEWLNWAPFSSTSIGTTISFQVKLYESTGIIEYYYRQEAGSTALGGFSIGMASSNTSFASLNNSSATPTVSNATSTNSITTRPATGQVYIFTPNQTAVAAPTTLTFSSVTLTSMTVNWVDNSTNETNFNVFRSTDGINYTYAGTVNSSTSGATGGAYNFNATGLTASTNYFWEVVANTEGVPSTALAGSQATNSCAIVGGTYLVGPTGTYATLTAALAALNTNGITGSVILELQSTYSSGSEIFPIIINSLPCLGSVNTLTIRPETGATGLVITSANTAATISIAGGNYVTIDGRPGGVGAVSQLTIANTATGTTGGTIQFLNDAHHNTVTYCTVTGVATATTAGNILFGTTTGSLGNSDNTISNCTIRDGATTPTNGIYAAGTVGFLNNNNTITNNNIFNFYNSASTTNGGVGINIAANNSNWTISNNSFYQTASRTTFGAGATFNGILISSATVNGVAITGNYIGGTAANCGGTAMTLNTTATLVFRGIQLTVGTTTATSVQGNTIQNIAFTTASTSTAQSLISAVTGNINIGNVTGNTLGSQSVANSVIFVQSTTSTAPFFCGIIAGTGTPGVINISNNTIGGFAVSNSSTGTIQVRGISFQSTATSYTISGNTIGSLTTTNSITNATNSLVAGIVGNSTSLINNITNNTVANIASTSTGTGASVVGIATPGSTGGAFTITGNTVRNLSSTAPNVGTGTGASVIGISQNAATTAGQTVSQNIVHTLSNTAATAAVNVSGIVISGPTTGTNLVTRNFVHSLTASSTGAAVINGINNVAGLHSTQNNMVRLGIDATGASIAGNYTINGINDVASTAGSQFIHNSVYIGGTGVVAGTNNTAAFNTATTTNTRIFRNNIFSNERTNGVGTGFNLAAIYAGTLPNPAGLTLSHNVYYSSVPGVCIRNATTNYTLGAWQTASSQDLNSYQATAMSQISFVNTTGNSGAVDLHITGTTVIEASGSATTTATDDYDGQIRSGLTPVDIGADAGNFTAIDLFAPVITYTPLTFTCATGNRTLSNVTITDASGVPAPGSGTEPRVYYRKNAGAYFSQPGSLSSGTLTNGIWSFTIVAADMGGLTAGDVVSYYVVAQDIVTPTPNISSNPNGVATGTVLSHTAPASPNSYNISTTLGGTYNVGTGQIYTTLTAAVNAYNTSCLTGPVVFNLTDANYSASETFPISINLNADASATNTLTIRPNGLAVTITGTTGAAVASLIKLNGSKYVTIDGLNTGGSSLTIENTSATAGSCVVWLASNGAGLGASNNAVKNTNIKAGVGQNAAAIVTYGVVVAGSALNATITSITGGDDNDNNTFQGNTFTKVRYAIFTRGGSTTNPNLGTVINNNIIGPSAFGADVIGKGGVTVREEDGVQIIGNEIRFVGGNFANTSAGADRSGITFGTDAGWTPTAVYVKNAIVTKNKIHDIIEERTFSASGIASGAADGANATNNLFANNIIYNVKANGTLGDQTVGIGLSAANGDRVVYNSIYLTGDTDPDAGAGAPSVSNFGISISSSAVTNPLIKDNAVYMDLTSSSTPSILNAAINVPSSFAWGTGSSNYNDFYFAPANTQGRVGCTGGSGGTFFATLSAWQTAVTQDANSVSADPLFPSPTVLQPAPFSPLVSAGNPVAGVTDDITGFTRSAIAPSIGAYEQAGDFTGPSITYVPLNNTLCTNDITLTPVTITDASGVNVTAGTRPRLYFKKSTNANTYVDNTNATNGWKYVEATGAGGSPFSFTTNFSLLFGGTPVTGDVIQYFVVAQDLAPTPNTSINSGTFAVTPSSVALTAAAFPIGGSINSYNISSGLSGTVTIGAAGTYTSLTGVGGLFATINAGGLSGNLTANIIDASVTESGANALNQIAYGCAGSYTLLIKPATTATLTGSVASNGLIRLNGADFVTIDGSNSGGTDRSLTITNTNTTAPTAVSVSSTGAGAGANNNTVKNCNINTGIATSIGYGVSVGGSTPGTSGADNDNTTIQNNNITVAPVGIYANGTAAVSAGGNDNLVILRNTIDYNGTLASLGIQAGNATGSLISQNTVSELTTATQSPTGISLESGFVSSSVTRNFVTKSVTTNTGGYGGRGITVGTGTATSNLTIANNVIYGVSGTNWSGYSNSSSMGIVIGAVGNSSTITTTTGGVNLYYNSVNMYGTYNSTTACLTTALYVGTGASGLDIRNNILVNSLVNSGSGSPSKAYAFYSAAPNTAYTTINYNDYYVSGAQGVLGFLTSDRTTLTALQTATGQDANSISANPAYASDVNLQPGIGSPVSGAATPIGTVPADITGFVRNAFTPTIGAYEQTGDFSGPAITYTVFGNTLCNTDRTLSPVTITDPSGVNTTPGTKPRLYFKKSTDANTYVGNTSADNGWKYVEASNASSPFSFTTDYSLLQSAVAAGDIIQYFVVAQDLAVTPSVSINSGNFAVAPSSVALTAGAFPIGGTINQYTVLSGGLSGTVTIGAAGTYPSLTGTGGLFAAINASGLVGNLTANIIDVAVTESGANALNSINYGCSGSYSLLIRPGAGVNTVLSGNTVSGAIIKLNGADNVTIDGSNNASLSRNMTIINNTTATATAVVWIASPSASDGSTNNTVKNCILNGNASTTTGYGVLTGGTVFEADALAPNSGTIIQNNFISKVELGISVIGTSSANLDAGNQIINNNLGSAAAGDGFAVVGIQAAFQSGIVIAGNEVQNLTITTAGSGDYTGIGVFESQNALINRNKVHGFSYTGGSTGKMYGILLATADFSTAGAPSKSVVMNNVVYDMTSNCISSFWSISGIDDEGGYNDKFYFNTVYLTGQVAASSTALSSCFANGNDWLGVACTTIDVRNNIFYMNGSSTGATPLYTHYTSATSNAGFTLNYNDLYVSTGGSAVPQIGRFNATNYSTLAAWKTATNEGANTISADPLFVSPTNLLLQAGSPAIGAGTTVGVTTDFTNSTRNNPPSMGAYESRIVFSAKMFLSGAYNAGLGRHKDVTAVWAAVLNASALSQPYNTAAFGNYAGTEAVTAGFFTSTAGTTDITDWVLVELRDATTPSTVITRRAAFVREDGMIVDVDGVSPISLRGFSSGNYFVVIRHRNHLGVRTSATQLIDGSSGIAPVFDYTTAQSQAYQDPAILALAAPNNNNAMRNLGGGVFGMWGGNGNANTTVRGSGPLAQNDYLFLISTTLGNDVNLILSNVYNNADYNMDGTVRANGPLAQNDYLFLISTMLVNDANRIITQHQ